MHPVALVGILVMSLSLVAILIITIIMATRLDKYDPIPSAYPIATIVALCTFFLGAVMCLSVYIQLSMEHDLSLTPSLSSLSLQPSLDSSPAKF